MEQRPHAGDRAATVCPNGTSQELRSCKRPVNHGASRVRVLQVECIAPRAAMYGRGLPPYSMPRSGP